MAEPTEDQIVKAIHIYTQRPEDDVRREMDAASAHGRFRYGSTDYTSFDVAYANGVPVEHIGTIARIGRKLNDNDMLALRMGITLMQ